MLASERAVLIRYELDGESYVGSGLRVRGRFVLTADHCAEGTRHQVVCDGALLDATVWVRSQSRDIDLAVLEVPTAREVEPLGYALVNRSVAATLPECQALGFPRWKRSNGRKLAQVDGYIPTAEGLTMVADRIQQVDWLALKATGPAPLTPMGSLEQAGSPWAGMSGAVVVTHDLVIGVVRSHNLTEGGGSLTVTPIDAINGLRPDVRSKMWAALGVDGPRALRKLPSPGISHPSQEIGRFGFINGFVSPPEEVRRRILGSLGRAKPSGIVIFTGHSGYGKTGLAGWAARQASRDFAMVVVVEFRDDWPLEVRGERAFEQFRKQIHSVGTSAEEVGIDGLLAATSTLLILDDVRAESDLEPFSPFFDRCTVLVTALDSKISTALQAGGKPLTHFDLTSPQEAEWVSEWARSILTREWKSDSAVGDLVERCASCPLLAARLNLAVRHQTRHTSSLSAFNETVTAFNTRLQQLGPHKFDPPGTDRHTSFRASAELMLQTVEEGFVAPPFRPGDKLKELGALPADAMVPVEVLDFLWDSDTTDETDSLVEYLCDLGLVQFARPEGRSHDRGRLRLLDSDRDYFRKIYPEKVLNAHQRLLAESRRKPNEPVVRDYLKEHRIWHLIGAQYYEIVAEELSTPEFLVDTALNRGVRAAEYDLALTLAHCSSRLQGRDELLRPLLTRIRQSIDLLEQCDSRQSFCPTLAGRLQGVPELVNFADSLSGCLEDSFIHVEGPPHDTDDPRLIRRLPTRRAGIKAFSWTAEPDRVGIVFRYGAVDIWNPSRSRRLQSRSPDSLPVALAAWSKRGDLIAIGRSDGTVTVWPLPQGEEPEALLEQSIAAVAWSRTNELAYAGWAGAIARWTRGGGTRLSVPDLDGARVTAMAWSHDATRLAVGTARGAVFVLVTDGQVQLLSEHPGGVASLAWSAAGRLACAGWEGTVRVIESDRSYPVVQPTPSDQRGPAVIAWDEDGNQLGIGGFDGAVTIWSAAQCRIVLPAAQSQTVRALAWSPMAPILATAHDGGLVQIWHETDRPDPLPILADQASILSVAWSSHDEHLATASSDGAVAIWAPFEDSGVLPSAIRTHGPTTVRCSPDGRRVATAEQAGAIRVWDAQTRDCRTLNSRAAWKPAIGWAPGGTARLATGGADGVVYEWNAEGQSDGTILHRHTAWVSDLAWAPITSGEQLATVGRDWVIHISQPPDPAHQLVAHEGGTTAMAWSPHGSLLATAGNDWLVRIWRRSRAASPADDGRWGLVAQFRPHLGGVTALMWGPVGTQLATAGWDRTVGRWLLQTTPASPSTENESTMNWSLMDTWQTRASAVTALAWSPDGASFVGGDRNGRLRLWRCGNLNSTEFRSRHESPITGLRWSKRVNRILSTGTDGTLREWSANGEEHARVVFRTPLYSLHLHEDSGLVAVGGEHGATTLRLDPESRAEHAV